MKEAYDTLNGEVTIHSLFEHELHTDGTVNVPPGDAVEAMSLLEEAGYAINSMEELRDMDGGEHFTRINFRES